jgi:hypothetical protein
MCIFKYNENKLTKSSDLDLPKGGEDCCRSKCGQFRNHLQTLWTDRTFTQVRRLTSEHKPNPNDPEDLRKHEDLTSTTFNDDWFDRETNDVYLRYRMKTTGKRKREDPVKEGIEKGNSVLPICGDIRPVVSGTKRCKADNDMDTSP